MLCESRAEASIVGLIRRLYRRIVLKTNAKAVKTTLSEIQSLRALFLQETNFEIRYHACHERGWADSYLLMVDELKVGYGSIKGQELEARDTVFEFYVTPPYHFPFSPEAKYRKISGEVIRYALGANIVVTYDGSALEPVSDT